MIHPHGLIKKRKRKLPKMSFSVGNLLMCFDGPIITATVSETSLKTVKINSLTTPREHVEN